MVNDPAQQTADAPARQDDTSTMPDLIPRAVVVLASVVTLGVVMSTLDTTVVTVGVDAMSRALKAPVSTIQWVATSYLLAFSAVIPLTGWVVDRFGIRRSWLTALLLFTVASALCGLSWSAGSLIVFRTMQGLGGGMLLPLAQTALARAAGPKLLGRVMAMAAIPGMLSPVFGPLIGGVIVDSLSWRWLFYVNLPIGAIALAMAARVMKTEPIRPEMKLDVLSVMLLSPGIGAVIYGFSEASGSQGFGSTSSLSALVIGAVMLAAFAVHSLRRGERALVNLRLFKVRGFSAAAATSFLLGASLFGALILFPLYYQLVRGQDSMTAGLMLAPQGIGAVLIMPYAGKLTDRLGPGPVVLGGLVLAMLGTLPYAYVGRHTSEPLLAGVLLVRGLGLGATFMPTLVAAYRSIAGEYVSQATSVVNIAQRVGGSLGTALVTLILQMEYQHHAGHEAQLGAVRVGSSENLVPAFDDALLWTLGFGLIALVPALLLPRKEQPAS